MRNLFVGSMLLVALIHALPVAGLLGVSKLETLYGVVVRDPNLELMLRHRAVLFGLLAAFIAYAAFRPELHRLALILAFGSVISFLALAWSIGGYNGALSRVVWADVIALAALIVATAVHLLRSGATLSQTA
jgi:hypothetical protein